MNLLNYIVWNPSVEALRLGPLSVRFYSLCWVVGLVLGYIVVQRLYRHQQIKKELFEPLFFYCFVGILVGARLGHCIFYQPDYYLTSLKGIVEMFLPIHFAPDSWDWRLTGYAGLASHGGTLGLMIALWRYVRWSKLSAWTVLDNIAIATPIVACFIRLGNLMNSEIIGRVTDVPWAFVFSKVDQLPRHPGQLYEALAYALFFVAGLLIYKQGKKLVGSGFYFGFCLTTIFTFRIFVEFFKEVQEAFEASMTFDMGQILSVPFVVLGVACMVGGRWMDRLSQRK
ncbi:MAG: prolipoprotein diacylglyceryl transferase [Bacteroidaceae bacterium]|nr:prolipoprotein diacylglyceryl transferase [Bacteroidaceae bacterium]